MSILSIQSHVVYGYVGNKAAVFPLQSMGYDVWPINTVQFSNHTGYGMWEGEVFSHESIRKIILGIENLGVINNCRAILSGYMGSKDICYELLDIVKRFKSKNSNILYLCDPVIGNNSCFVRPEVLNFFQENLNADIITPNAYEAETLSGILIKTIKDVSDIANYFHNLGIKIVVITGLKLKISESDGEDDLYVFASSGKKYYLVRTIEYQFKTPPNGTGDLFSALFLGSYLKNLDIEYSIRKSVYFMELVMKKTYEQHKRELMVTSINYAIYDSNFFPKIVLCSS